MRYLRYLRFTASLMLCGIAVPVLALSGRGLVVIPRFLRESGAAAMSPGDMAAVLVLYPLICLMGLGNGLLLGWSGVRGLASAGRAAQWNERQGAGLVGLLLAGLASLVSAAAAPPDSRAVVALPVSLEAVAHLFLLVLSLTGMLVMLCMLLEEPPRPARPRGRRARSSAVRTVLKTESGRRLEPSRSLVEKM